MSGIDWLVLLLLACAVVFALWSNRRRKKRAPGCGGCCSNCPMSGAGCQTQPPQEKE